jgi:hypothetical protein
MRAVTSFIGHRVHAHIVLVLPGDPVPVAQRLDPAFHVAEPVHREAGRLPQERMHACMGGPFG